MVYEDVFAEQLVKHKPRLKNIVIKVLAILMGVVVTAFGWLVTQNLYPVLLAAAWLGAWYIFTSENYEFEYSFTNGELDIDRIVAQRRRKRLLSTNCRTFVLMAPCDAEHEKLTENMVLARTVDYSSSPSANGRWFFVFTGTSGVMVKAIIEPTPRMLQVLKDALKDKVQE